MSTHRCSECGTLYKCSKCGVSFTEQDIETAGIFSQDGVLYHPQHYPGYPVSTCGPVTSVEAMPKDSTKAVSQFVEELLKVTIKERDYERLTTFTLRVEIENLERKVLQLTELLNSVRDAMINHDVTEGHAETGKAGACFLDFEDEIDRIAIVLNPIVARVKGTTSAE